MLLFLISSYSLNSCVTCLLNMNLFWPFQKDIAAIFKKADKDNSGTLTVKEFQEVMKDISER